MKPRFEFRNPRLRIANLKIHVSCEQRTKVTAQYCFVIVLLFAASYEVDPIGAYLALWRPNAKSFPSHLTIQKKSTIFIKKINIKSLKQTTFKNNTLQS